MPKRKIRPGIMVAGAPRSGSTILSKVLALSPTVGYVEEPFNWQTGMIGTDDRFFPYIYEGSAFQPQYDAILNDILRGTAHYKENMLQPETKNPLRMLYRQLFTNRYQIRYWLDTHDPRVKKLVMKDPTATLSTEHFLKNKHLSVIYTLRHPCGVVTSHQRLGWSGSPIQDFLSQKHLYDRMPREVQAVKGRTLTEVEGLAWYWRAVNEFVLQVARQHPTIPIVEHETFSRHPEAVVRQLYGQFDIPFTPKIADELERLTGSQNPTDPTNNEIHVLQRNSRDNVDRWKKMISKADERVIMKICGSTYEKLQALPNTIKITS